MKLNNILTEITIKYYRNTDQSITITPMFSLILETSSEKGCVILAENDTPIAVKPLPAGPALSKCLALEVKNMLPAGLKIDLIAVGTGPGSYTGIRVGAALGKALAYGWKIPLIGFCSLEAFGPAPVLVDARSGGFYALLDKEPLLISPEDPRLQKIDSYNSPHPEMIKKRIDSKAIAIEADADPKRLAVLVYERFLQGGFTPLELNYLAFP